MSTHAEGIALWLHGAMVLEDSEDGEGDLLEAIRMKTGPAVPLMVALDLHGNVTRRMVEYANGLFPNDFYPPSGCHPTSGGVSALVLTCHFMDDTFSQVTSRSARLTDSSMQGVLPITTDACNPPNRRSFRVRVS